MNRRRLGKSGITVSEICLGTMTFGLQSDEKESFAIMDKAFEAGVNFMDTAEIYPVPPSVCLLYTSPSPRDATLSRMPSSA